MCIYIYIYTHIYMCIHIYIYICVCVYLCYKASHAMELPADRQLSPRWFYPAPWHQMVREATPRDFKPDT